MTRTKHSAPRRTNEAGLAKLFEDLKGKYFAGRLRRYRVRFSRVRLAERGHCDWKRCLILIDGSLASQPEHLRETLVHEMCHVGSPFHGKAFQTNLRRLAELGERAAAVELEKVEKRTPFGALAFQFRHSIRDAILLDRFQGTYIQLVSAISRDYGIRPREFSRKFPWARQTFRNALKEAALNESE